MDQSPTSNGSHRSHPTSDAKSQDQAIAMHPTSSDPSNSSNSPDATSPENALQPHSSSHSSSSPSPPSQSALANARHEIQQKVADVSLTIEQKRRRLLRSDRLFKLDNLKQLSESLNHIVTIITGEKMITDDGRLVPRPLDVTLEISEEKAPHQTVGPIASPEKVLEEAEANTLKSYIIDCLPNDNHQDLQDFITAIQEFSEKVAQYHADQVAIARQQESPRSSPEHDPTLVLHINQKLHQWQEISQYLDLATPSPLQRSLRGPIPPSAWSETLDELNDEIEQANHYITSLRGNCRLEVARELNQIKMVLGRILVYSDIHGVSIKSLNQVWGLPKGPLLASIRQIELAVSDAEWGTTCSLELLQKTRISIDRMLYRYEYGLPFKWPLGWVLNRLNDGKRLIRSVKRWHDHSDMTNPTIIKSQILLGLAITSGFWLFLFMLVSGLSLVARVGISVLTPSEVQETVESDRDQIEAVKTLAEGHLTRYHVELQDSLTRQIEDQKTLIETSLSNIQHLVTTDFAASVIQADSDPPSLSPPSVQPQTTNSPSALAATNGLANGPASNPTGNIVRTSPPSAGGTSGNSDAIASTPTPSRTTDTTLSFENLRQSCNLNLSPPVNPDKLTECADSVKALASQLGSNSTIENQPILQENLKVLSQNLTNIKSYQEETLKLSEEKNKFTQNLADRQSDLNQKFADLSLSTTKTDGERKNPVTWKIWESLFSWSKNDIFNDHINRILLALLAGAMGSAISLLIRMNDLDTKNLSAPFLLGLFQPFIGAVTSVVVVAILSTEAVEVINIFPDQLQLKEPSELLDSPTTVTNDSARYDTTASRSNPVGRLDTHEVYKILIIGFFIGFSERLTKDALGKLSPGNFNSPRSL